MRAALFPDLVVDGETVPHALVAAEAENHTAPADRPGIAGASPRARWRPARASCKRRGGSRKKTLENAGQSRRPFNELFEPAMRFLTTPRKARDSGRLDLRRLVLRLAFTGRLAYHRFEGLRNPDFAIPFKALAGFQEQELVMARWGGFEPPTP
ncbi:MAG: hypothetical protein QNJ44_05490 [Rhodobacter sp.]|nr:hypothetical protein [Rhodobacter sp.]